MNAVLRSSQVSTSAGTDILWLCSLPLVQYTQIFVVLGDWHELSHRSVHMSALCLQNHTWRMEVGICRDICIKQGLCSPIFCCGAKR